MNTITTSKQIVIASTSTLQDISGVRNRSGKREDHALFFSPDVELLVVSTRTCLGDHDNWWQELVSDENVFGPLPFTIDQWTSISTHLDQNPFYPAGWHSLYDHLGLDWPIDEDRVNVHWTSAAYHLQSLGYHVRW